MLKLIVLSEVGSQQRQAEWGNLQIAFLTSPLYDKSDSCNFKGCLQDDMIVQWSLSLIKRLFFVSLRGCGYTILVDPSSCIRLQCFTRTCAVNIKYYIHTKCFFLFRLWECSKLKVGWDINLNYPVISLAEDVCRIAICQFFLLTVSLFMRAMPRGKVGTQGPVDLVGPDRSEKQSCLLHCFIARELTFTNSKKLRTFS